MSTSTEEVRQAFLAHRRKHGIEAANKIIKRIVASGDLESATDEERERLARELAVTDESGSELIAADGTLNGSAIYAKWNAARPRATR